MSRAYMCDHCGEHESIVGKGIQRPARWGTVRVTVRLSDLRGSGLKAVQAELCPKCVQELCLWLGAK